MGNVKLVEIDPFKEQLTEVINDFFGCDAAYFDVNPLELATHLIANGVTLDKDENKISSKWIPVTERLPDAGVRVLATDGDFVGEFYLNDRGQWRRYNVNHHDLLLALDILWWMPMPEPPKGE